MFYRDERLAVFIDGTHLSMAARTLGLAIDYAKMRREFMRNAKLVSLSYYRSVIETEDHVSVRPLLDWLAYNGFRVITRPDREWIDAQGRTRHRTHMEIDITVGAFEAAAHVDHILLILGDGNYAALVEALQRRGVRVTVISTIRTPTSFIADDLRRAADQFLDLDELRDTIGKPATPGDRPSPAPREARRTEAAL